MLSAAELRATQQPRRPRYSDKQRYQEYILQRIEGYKNSIGRAELLRLGDEAVGELLNAPEGQFRPPSQVRLPKVAFKPLRVEQATSLFAAWHDNAALPNRRRGGDE